MWRQASERLEPLGEVGGLEEGVDLRFETRNAVRVRTTGHTTWMPFAVTSKPRFISTNHYCMLQRSGTIEGTIPDR